MAAPISPVVNRDSHDRFEADGREVSFAYQPDEWQPLFSAVAAS